MRRTSTGRTVTGTFRETYGFFLIFYWDNFTRATHLIMNAWLCLERLCSWNFCKIYFTLSFMLFLRTGWALWRWTGRDVIFLKAWSWWFNLYLGHMSHCHLIGFIYSDVAFLSCWMSLYTAWSLIFFFLLQYWLVRLNNVHCIYQWHRLVFKSCWNKDAVFYIFTHVWTFSLEFRSSWHACNF